MWTTATTTAPPPGKAAVKTDMVPSLIVMNAHGADLQGSTLTLTGVSPNSIVFADRPVRAAGHVLTEHLVEEWSTGSFARDPPNATVSVLSRDGASTELFGSWIWSLGEAFVCTIEAWLREDSQVRPLLGRGRGLAARDPEVHRLVVEVRHLLKPSSALRDLVERAETLMAEA